MKKLLILLAVFAMSSATQAADVAGWSAYVIRQSGGTNPSISDITYLGTDAKEFVTSAGGMKAAWGTDSLKGQVVSDITKLSIARLDDYTRYAATTGMNHAPYINIWIKDANGNYAVLANEPSNGEWTGTSEWNVTSWSDLAGKSAKIYEYSSSFIKPSGTSYTFASFAGYTMEAPSVAALTTGWTGLGSGAPRELGTNAAYAFNWVFGDTLSNYVTDKTGYIVANPVAIPEPSTIVMLVLAGLAMIGYSARRR